MDRVQPLAGPRREQILSYLRGHGSARVAELVSALQVTSITVRRDLDLLASEGLVDRVHGGARINVVSADKYADMTTRCAKADTTYGVDVRGGRRTAAQEGIAAVAAGMVQPGDTVALGPGEITFAIANAISNVANLTVITNSIPISMMLNTCVRPDLTTILTGGEQTPAQSLVGPVAVATLQPMHSTIAFIGAAGVDPEVGVTTPNLLEADTARALLSTAARVVLVADASKWRQVSLRAVASLEEFNTWICDDALPPEAQAEAKACLRQLLLVPVDR